MYRAVRYQSSSPEAQANGQVLLPYLHVLRGSKLEYLIKTYQLDHIQLDAFYPQHVVCDMQRRMADQPDQFTGELVAIGVKSIESIGFPPGITTIQEALDRLHEIYQSIHRHIPPEEGWRFEALSERALVITFNSPYEPFAAYGYIRGIADRFRLAHQTATVIMGQEDDLTVFTVFLSDKPPR